MKSFDELSLKVVAVRAAVNSDFAFQFPASGPETTSSALAVPLALLARPSDPPPEIATWHHGGLNE